VEQLYQVTSVEDQAPALWAAVQQHIAANPTGYKARSPGRPPGAAPAARTGD
jgi:hypothetical protein